MIFFNRTDPILQPPKQFSWGLVFFFSSLKQSPFMKKALGFLILLTPPPVGTPKKYGTAQTEPKDGLIAFCKATKTFVYMKPTVLTSHLTSGSSTDKSQQQYNLYNALCL